MSIHVSTAPSRQRILANPVTIAVHDCAALFAFFQFLCNYAQEGSTNFSLAIVFKVGVAGLDFYREHDVFACGVKGLFLLEVVWKHLRDHE